jgi:hypothetical protein
VDLAQLRDRVNTLKSMTIDHAWCGWMVDDVAAFVYSLIKFTQPDIIIQTGHLWGKSAVVAMEAMSDDFLRKPETRIEETEPFSRDQIFYEFTVKRAPSPRVRRFISVDPRPLGGDEPIAFLKKTYPFYQFYQATSENFFQVGAQQLAELTAGNVLLGIVDGDHTAGGCSNDLDQLGALNARYIIVDDTRWIPELGTVTRKFAVYADYDLAEFPAYNGLMWLSKRQLT